MPVRIQQLPEFLINQIAAGEVIERPASVVKELLENSLDAEAHTIEIDIEDGGLQLIKVTDDGTGIVKDDLRLACCRHATSKIRSLEELERLRTLGFRGEALSSVASIGKLKLSSRARGAELAWEVVSSGRDDNAATLRPSALTIGTMVEVRDLFFNTPARRKFLRSPRSEFLQILNLVRRMAMSRPEVSFRLAHNRRQIVRYSATTPEDRGRQIFGASMMRTARAFMDEVDDVAKLWGWLFVPMLGVARANEQYLFLNGRMLRDRQLVHALRQAAEGLVTDGETVGGVVFIEVDPLRFDVNVHPTKLEVRFRDIRMLHDQLYSVARRTLNDGSIIAASVIGEASLTYPGAQSAAVGSFLSEQLSSKQEAGQIPPKLQNTRLSSEVIPSIGKPICIVYQRFLLTTTGTNWNVVDLERLLIHLVDAELKKINRLHLLVSIPLLLPTVVTTELAHNWGGVIDGLTACGFALETRQGVLYCLRAPALTRAFDNADFLRRLETALNGSVATEASWHSWFVPWFIRFVLSYNATISKQEWLDACLSELPKVPDVESAPVWRALRASEIADWFDARG